MIKVRLEKALEQIITRTQYGFRKSKSCAHALHLIRRIIDLGEMSNENIITIFLDWEKAFDKVNHKKMIEALKRVKIPQHYHDIIEDLYSSPQFKANYEEQTSDWKKQNSGIRQGCTLSPYLFIILMSVLIHDINKYTEKLTKNRKIPGLE